MKNPTKNWFLIFHFPFYIFNLYKVSSYIDDIFKRGKQEYACGFLIALQGNNFYILHSTFYISLSSAF